MPGHGGIRTYDLWNSNRPDRVAQLAEHWASRFESHRGQAYFSKPAQCGYTLRVTSHKHTLLVKIRIVLLLY